MAESENSGLTPLGKMVSFLLVVVLIAVGAWVVFKRGASPQGQQAPSPNAVAVAPPAAPADAGRKGAAPLLVSEMKTEVPRLAAPVAYQPKDNTIVVELSEYAGYSGLIVANGGMAPNEDSIFFKRHGFKVKLTLSEEESWSALNSGRMAASATTADVLAVYGRQFQVVVPAQIGYSRGADGIVVRSDINRINQLKGKTLTCSQFTESEFFIRYLAQEAGLGVHMLPDTSTPPDPDCLNLFFCKEGFAAGDMFLDDVKSGYDRLAGCVTWDPKTTEVADGSAGKRHILTTNRNLLIVADILIVNKGFAQANPDKVQGLVEGLLEGNRMVRDNPEAYLDVIAHAFNSNKDPIKDKDDLWDRAKARGELAKVHLANLPENLAFFSGAIDAAGSFNGIYQSAVLAYGQMIRDPVDGDGFVDGQYLKVLDQSGMFKDQKIAIMPVRTAGGAPLETNPLLSKDIRFYFEPNSSKLDMQSQDNLKNLASIKQLLQVSPGSKVLLRGHVDNGMIAQFRAKGGEGMVQQEALVAMQLSKDRAVEIRRLLIETQKVDPARLDTIGRGWEEPVGTDGDKNRRVEVYWYTLE